MARGVRSILRLLEKAAKKKVPTGSGVDTPSQPPTFNAPESGLPEFQHVPQSELPWSPKPESLAVSDTVDVQVKRKPRHDPWRSLIDDIEGKRKPRGNTTTVPVPTTESTPRRPTTVAVWPHTTRQVTTGLSVSDTIRVDRERPKFKPLEPPSTGQTCEEIEHALRRSGMGNINVCPRGGAHIRLSGSTSKKKLPPSVLKVRRGEFGKRRRRVTWRG